MAYGTTTLNPGTEGDDYAKDEIAGVSFQRVKPAFGVEGSAVDVSSSNPLPVTISGAATAANQSTANGLLTTIDTDTGNIATAASAIQTAVQVMDDWDETDRCKTNPIVGQAGVAAGAGAVGVTVQRMTLASDDPAVALLGTIDADTGAMATSLAALDNAVSGNELQVDVVAALPAGTNNIGDVDVLSVVPGTAATSLGKAEDAAHTTADTGVLMLGVRRDAAAVGSDTDGDYSTLNVDGSGRLWTHDPQALAVLNTVASNGTDLLVDTGAIRTAVETLDNAISGSEMQVDVVGALPAGANLIGSATAVGTAAHGAAVSGNPVLVGVEARTTDGTAVDSGDVVRPMADAQGKLVTVQGALHTRYVSGVTNITDVNADDLIAAAASTRTVVTGISVTNKDATVGTTVSIRDGTTAKVTAYAAPEGGGFVIAPGAPIFVGTANTAITAICGTDSSDCDITVWGYQIPG